MQQTMKQSILFCCLWALLLGSCVKEPELGPASLTEGETWVTLDFAHNDYEQVKVTTRSTLGLVAESRVTNLYVLLFDRDGNRAFGHYFDSDNKRSTRDEVVSANTNCWMVDNLMKEGEQTRGTIRMKIPTLTGGTFYIITNLDTDMLNIAPEKFSFIRTRAELEALSVLLNQEITSRNGMFPMSGHAEGVTITKDGITSATGGSLVIPLNRMDSKIEVRVRTAVGNETDVEDGSGNVTIQRIKDFKPESWHVVNLPKGSYLVEHDLTTDDSHDAETGFFDSQEINFETQTDETFTYDRSDGTGTETVTAPVHGFSFYMYENRPDAKKSVSSYHERDRRIKDASGAYDTTNGLWENAPETATYLVIKGDVSMDVDVSSEAKTQTLNASVVYYIHLGNIARDLNDYRVNRNTHYTYTITLKGVENIQVEVETNVENESGATGHVYVARESIYTFDAHYGQRVFAFDQASITPDDVTWYVKTPFGREGMPEVVNGAEIPNGLDYKWVSFRINKLDASGSYSHNNQTYNPNEVMDIIEFCNYIREQKRLFDNHRTNAFRLEEDAELKQQYPNQPEIYNRYRIYATVFVDEFYYDRDPISGEVRPTLWKEFVNQPNRTMHILCDTKTSSDGDSSTTGSVVTIRQNSIQTIYDTTNDNLQTAWGGESIDETEGQLWFYNRTETHRNETVYPYVNYNYGNTSRSNGLYNTALLWQLINGYGGFTYRRWSDYLDYDRENDHPQLFLRDDDELATARYTCLMRNRDNDGDGVIEATEIRWYLASIQQLTALYVGDQGISSEAQLYDRFNGYGKDQTDAYGSQLWRRHIVSSSRWGKAGEILTNYPIMLWAEEGLSTSAYKQYAMKTDNYNQLVPNKPGRYAVRCVRNLGMDPASESEAIAALNDVDHMPEYSIVFTPVNENYSTSSVYRFDLSRINKKSTRYYTSRELEPGDEYAESARTYTSFETGPLATFENNNDENIFTGDYGTLKEMIDRGESPCPEGYRVPNIREASLMSNYITDGVNPYWWKGYSYVNSYYSFGPLGKNYDGKATSWYYTNNHITTEPEGSTIRCVRDIQ